MVFNPNELRALIENRLNDNVNIPNGHKGAFVIYYDPILNNSQVAVAFKNDSGWEIQGDLQYNPQTTGLSSGVQVMKSW